MDQLRILRDDEQAIIELRDAVLDTTHLRISSEVTGMTDEEILVLFTRVIAAGLHHRDEPGDYVALEIPGGGDDGSLPAIFVDDQEFT